MFCFKAPVQEANTGCTGTLHRLLLANFLPLCVSFCTNGGNFVMYKPDSSGTQRTPGSRMSWGDAGKLGGRGINLCFLFLQGFCRKNSDAQFFTQHFKNRFSTAQFNTFLQNNTNAFTTSFKEMLSFYLAVNTVIQFYF